MRKEMKKQFTCNICYEKFSVSQKVLDRYPGWIPRRCMDCKNLACQESDYRDEDIEGDTSHPGHPSNYGDH